MSAIRGKRDSAQFRFQTLRTHDAHRVSYAVAGANGGVPVVVLHGGPGSGSQPAAALRLFDLDRFRVVLIDQRGTGRSSPRGSVRRNRTDRLIDDIEAVRSRLGIERWGVLGGSWGASLALAYAGTHPHAVTGVVLRGLFLTSAREVRQLFVGSRKRAPRAWAKLRATARCERPERLLACCHARLQRGASASRQREVALAWRGYENAVLASAATRRKLVAGRITAKDSRKLADKYRIQAHYLVHRCWLGETQLLALARCAAAAGVPLAAVHGSRDPVCPPDNVRRLARAVPTAHVECVRGGHLASDPALHEHVVHALKAMFLNRTQEGRTLRHAA